jgi:hypothetical protein
MKMGGTPTIEGSDKLTRQTEDTSLTEILSTHIQAAWATVIKTAFNKRDTDKTNITRSNEIKVFTQCGQAMRA